MALKSQSATKAALDTINALCNGGSLRLYGGAVPSTVDDLPSTLLVTIALESPAFATATVDATEATATLAIGAGKAGTVDVAGTGSNYRILSSGGDAITQGTIGVSGADLNFADGIVWNLGGVVDVTSLVRDMPVA